MYISTYKYLCTSESMFCSTCMKLLHNISSKEFKRNIEKLLKVSGLELQKTVPILDMIRKRIYLETFF